MLNSAKLCRLCSQSCNWFPTVSICSFRSCSSRCAFSPYCSASRAVSFRKDSRRFVVCALKPSLWKAGATFSASCVSRARLTTSSPVRFKRTSRRSTSTRTVLARAGGFAGSCAAFSVTVCCKSGCTRCLFEPCVSHEGTPDVCGSAGAMVVSEGTSVTEKSVKLPASIVWIISASGANVLRTSAI